VVEKEFLQIQWDIQLVKQWLETNVHFSGPWLERMDAVFPWLSSLWAVVLMVEYAAGAWFAVTMTVSCGGVMGKDTMMIGLVEDIGITRFYWWGTRYEIPIPYALSPYG
jgi:hypothetical protein